VHLLKPARTARIAGPVLIALAIAFPASVLATTNEPIAATGGMTAVLPLLGASLTVEVKLDVVGNIAEVNVDPAGAVTKRDSNDHKVKFTSADGTVKVDVKAKGSKLSVTAKAGSLANLSGSGAWSADVFGTDDVSTVRYTVGAAAGHPTLAIDGVTPGGGATFEVSPIKTGDDGDKASASVTFKLDGYTKKLTISVAVNDDGKASLKITLSGKDKQRLSGSLTDLQGARTWSAHLCDGTPVSVNFHVTPSGGVAFDSAVPTSVKVKTEKHGFKATFDGTKVGVSVKLQARRVIYELKVDGKSGKCDKGDKEKKDKHEKEKKDTHESDRKGDGDDESHADDD
jgi:hypothetical protein